MSRFGRLSLPSWCWYFTHSHADAERVVGLNKTNTGNTLALANIMNVILFF